LVCDNSCSPLPSSTHHATTGQESITLVSSPSTLSITLRGARCFTRISFGSACCGSAFWSRAASGAPLIHRSPWPSHHPNAKRRVPSSHARPTIAPCVVARKPGVLPWRERKSTRGTLRAKTIFTASYACPRPDCDYFGNTDFTFHALVGDGLRGADGIQWLKCQACSKRSSIRRGRDVRKWVASNSSASPRITHTRCMATSMRVVQDGP